MVFNSRSYCSHSGTYFQSLAVYAHYDIMPWQLSTAEVTVRDLSVTGNGIVSRSHATHPLKCI